MTARALSLSLLLLAGCRTAPARVELPPAPYRPVTPACGELAGLAKRPLLAITRRQCLALALAHGRLDDEPLRGRIAAVAQSNHRRPADRAHAAALEPPLELLRLVEAMTVAVDRDYWTLRAAYAVYLCRAAAADAARELEEVAERLVAARRHTVLDLEKLRQSRIACELDREQALHGTGDAPGLVEAEARLRATLGYTDGVPGLLLPSDAPPVADPSPSLDAAARMEQARTHRLTLVSARFRVLVADGEVEAATDKNRPQRLANREQARLKYAESERDVQFEIDAALQRLAAANRSRELTAERRASLHRQLAGSERLEGDAAVDRLEVLETRIRLAAAAAAEHQAVRLCCLATTGLDRATGILLVRDGIRLPTPPRPGPPRPKMSEPEAARESALRGTVHPRLDLLVACDPLAPLPEFLAPLAGSTPAPSQPTGRLP